MTCSACYREEFDTLPNPGFINNTLYIGRNYQGTTYFDGTLVSLYSKTGRLKHQLVSYGIMETTTQINVRLADTIITKATHYAKKHSFNNLQELIKENLREKVFGEPTPTKEELMLVKKLTRLTEEKNLWGTEEDLFRKLRL